MKRKANAIALLAILAFSIPMFAKNDTNCFQQYEDDVLNCSYLPSGSREMCNLDAAANLAGCVRRTIIGV